MVRRVGFGNTPKPEKSRKSRAPVPEDTHETRPMPEQPNPAPMPDQQPDQTPPKAARSGAGLSTHQVAKIIIAILLAIRIDNTFVSIMLVLWVIWSLSRTALNTMNPKS